MHSAGQIDRCLSRIHKHSFKWHADGVSCRAGKQEPKQAVQMPPSPRDARAEEAAQLLRTDLERLILAITPQLPATNGMPLQLVCTPLSLSCIASCDAT